MKNYLIKYFLKSHQITECGPFRCRGNSKSPRNSAGWRDFCRQSRTLLEGKKWGKSRRLSVRLASRRSWSGRRRLGHCSSWKFAPAKVFFMEGKAQIVDGIMRKRWCTAFIPAQQLDLYTLALTGANRPSVQPPVGQNPIPTLEFWHFWGEKKRKTCNVIAMSWYYVNIKIFQGNKVFEVIADFRKCLWTGHDAHAKIMNVEWYMSTQSA